METTHIPDAVVAGDAATPGRLGAAADIVIFIAASLALWFVEKGMRSAGWLPFDAVGDGALALIGGFFVVLALMRWRGQHTSDLGLRRPQRRWWFIPLWGFIVLVVNVVAQLTIVPTLGALFNLPPPDLTRYASIHGNFSLFVVTALGAMVTGGFMEEVIYRGFMIDRLKRLLGGGRRGLVAAALLCGVPFGLIHFQWGVGGIFLTTVMGSLLGAMFLATRGNLWPLVAAHATMDFILMLQVYVQGVTPTS